MTKPKHRPSIALSARATLELLNIAVGQDFHTLTTGQVESLVAEADRVRYQKPANANGSRARYFHYRLQREARY